MARNEMCKDSASEKKKIIIIIIIPYPSVPHYHKHYMSTMMGHTCSGQCSFPPALPRLKLATKQREFPTYHTVRYSCHHRLLPLAGSGLSQCSPFGQWSYPTLVCTGETRTHTLNTCRVTETKRKWVECEAKWNRQKAGKNVAGVWTFFVLF